MKYIIPMIAISSMALSSSFAIEEAEYLVVKKDGRFETRDYKPYLLAEIVVDASMEDAGNLAFRPLFKYISGENTSKTNIQMTVPVSQEKASEKISMTAPVSQEKTQHGYTVSFMMPAEYTMTTIPTPINSNIKIRQIPAHRVASVRYSGRWTEVKYLKYKKKLEEWLTENKMVNSGNPVWARYNPPFTPWFFRRNEILIPIED